MLDELQHLLLIAEHGTFTEASRHAHLSQPALTASIRRLEQSFGAPLLTRGRRGAELTAAGAALVPRARAAFAALEDGRRAVEEIAGLRAGEVRIGAGAASCTYLLPPYIAAFRRAHPSIRFRLREGLPDAVLEEVERGEVDLGVLTARPGLGDPWLRDDLLLVAAPGHSARGAPFVTFPRGSTHRQLLDELFPEADVVMELSSIAAVKANVRAGIGIALISSAAVAADLAAKRLVRLRDPRTPVRRELALVHRGVDRLAPAAAELRLRLLAGARGRR